MIHCFSALHLSCCTTDVAVLCRGCWLKSNEQIGRLLQSSSILICLKFSPKAGPLGFYHTTIAFARYIMQIVGYNNRLPLTLCSYKNTNEEGAEMLSLHALFSDLSSHVPITPLCKTRNWRSVDMNVNIGTTKSIRYALEILFYFYFFVLFCALGRSSGHLANMKIKSNHNFCLVNTMFMLS